MNTTAGHTNGHPASNDLIGYRLESVGGSAGTVDEDTRYTSEEYLVVRAGRWPFRHKVVVPSAAVNCVDYGERRVWVERDRKSILEAPSFDQERHGHLGASVTRPVA